MTNRLLAKPHVLAMGLALGAVSCSEDEDSASEVNAVEIDGVWVFTYGEPPDASMDALGGGQATVVDGCLQMGDAVVIWREEDLDTVAGILSSIDAGEPVYIQVSGGGLSLDEGSTLDDFPDEVSDHCAPIEIWFAGSESPTFASEG